MERPLPEEAMKGSLAFHLLPRFWRERSMYIFRVTDVNGTDSINIDVLCICYDVSDVYSPVIVSPLRLWLGAFRMGRCRGEGEGALGSGAPGD